MEDNKDIMKPMIALMMVVMIGGVLTTLLTTPVVASTKGTIVINTIPTGASISVNGSSVGVSPITVEVNPGTYTILITLAGYNDATTSIIISAGETRTLDVSLTEAGGQWTPIDIIWS